MPVKLTTTIRIRMKECDGEWSFPVRIPAQSVINQLEPIFGPARHGDTIRALAGDPESVRIMRDLAKRGIGAREAMRDPEITARVMALMGTGAIHSVAITQEERCTAAELIAPSCGQPCDITDDDGRPLTWEMLRTANEPLYFASMLAAASAACDKARGEGESDLKNS